jgi:hypothetical protein
MAWNGRGGDVLLGVVVGWDRFTDRVLVRSAAGQLSTLGPSISRKAPRSAME